MVGKGQIMKNPLNRRLLRELKSELGKYLVIFILLTGTIGFVSGFLVADGSMLSAYEESFEKYQIEDGNFRTAEKLTESQRAVIEAAGVTLYDNYYIEWELTNESTIRIFQNREKVNKICVMEGRMPDKKGEIAIDRMYADNNELSIGDMLKSGSRTWEITGLAAFSDYSCLFSDNNDSMFDSVKFGVAAVAQEEFSSYDESEMIWSLSWIYDDSPADETEEKEKAEDLMEELAGETSLEAFVPRYLNKAIQFTGEDMGSDRAMIMVLLYVIMVIMAFVFGVTTSNMIHKEANVIGTLRASGYKRNELVRHYMTLPVIVTIVSALFGNILGYTIFKDICAGMYYGSYSLPTYVTIWNGEAFFLTTVIPVFLMAVINYGILSYKLTLSPLQFLRRDLTRRKQKRAVPLSVRIGFFQRFRLRVIFQNIGSYAVLFAGIIFANLLLMFGLLMPELLRHYQAEMENNMLCKYQYILSAPAAVLGVQTENEDAEEFSAYALETLEGRYKAEEVLLYGIQENSRYVSEPIGKNEVFVSSAYAEKYDVESGDKITLKEKYENKEYSFEIAGIYDYEGALSVFMQKEKLNDTFELETDFTGFFSDTEITDVDEKLFSSVIDIDDLTKLSRQIEVSMGSMMDMVNVFAVVMFAVLIYLLTKVIIEKNTQSISLTKILGYTNGEISRLYIAATTIVVIVFILLSLPIEREIMQILFEKMIMTSISGWIPFYINYKIYIEIFLAGVMAYGAVALSESRRIRKIPMDEALKNVE